MREGDTGRVDLAGRVCYIWNGWEWVDRPLSMSQVRELIFRTQIDRGFGWKS